MFLAEEKQNSFDDSDEEEVKGMLAIAPSCPVMGAGQSHEVVNARVKLSNPIGTRAQEDSSAAEAFEKVLETLPELVGREGDPQDERLYL